MLFNYQSSELAAAQRSAAAFVFAPTSDRQTSARTTTNTLWTFGGGSGTGYSYGSIYDDFGVAYANYSQTTSGTLTQYHLYNVSVDGGLWVQRLNGLEQNRRTGQPTTFSSAPTIGGSNSSFPYYLKGDIAEIIIYDHALTDSERAAVCFALASKYQVTDPVQFAQ